MTRVWLCVAWVVLSLVGDAPTARTARCLIDPCCSSASSAGGVLLVCPAGDGPTLSSIGATVSVTVLTCYCGDPLPGIPAEDFWIQQNNLAPQALCGGYRSSDADGASDLNGQATISGSIAAGGYWPDALHVVAQGMAIGSGCNPDVALSLVLVSPDINGDLVVDILDVASFAEAFSGGAGTVDPRVDFDGNGQIDLVDLSLFAHHYYHRCE